MASRRRAGRSCRFLYPISAAVFRAEHRYARIVRPACQSVAALADAAAAGVSHEHLELKLAVVWSGDRHRDDSVDDREPARVTVRGDQGGISAVPEALAAIVGQSHAVLAVAVVRLADCDRPVSSVALRHGGAGREGDGCNHKDLCDGPDMSSHFATSGGQSKVSFAPQKDN